MSLESPTKLERFAAFITTASPARRILVYCVCALVVFGLILLTIDQFSNGRVNRDIERRKANINAALSRIQQKEQGIANLNERLAAEKSAANIETQGLLNATNATETKRIETNKALANLDASKNINTANSSVSDLEKALDGLDK